MTEKILIGSKPVMVYVLNAMSRFKDEKEVEILARGKSISRAVDVAEILTKRFMPNLKIIDMKSDTESYTDTDNKERKVSAITIKLKSE